MWKQRKIKWDRATGSFWWWLYRWNKQWDNALGGMSYCWSKPILGSDHKVGTLTPPLASYSSISTFSDSFSSQHHCFLGWGGGDIHVLSQGSQRGGMAHHLSVMASQVLVGKEFFFSGNWQGPSTGPIRLWWQPHYLLTCVPRITYIHVDLSWWQSPFTPVFMSVPQV